MSKEFLATKISDLMSAFPELSNQDIFKKTVEEALNAGFSFKVEIFDKIRGRKSSTGKIMNCRISRNGKGFLIKRMTITNTTVTFDEYEKEKDSFLERFEQGLPSGYRGDKELRTLKKVNIKNTSWGELAQVFGNLIKEELTDARTCPKCGGSGKLQQYAHIENGLCFKCLGVGKWIEPKK